MMKGEIEYWLTQGKTIFRHTSGYWMRLFAENGSRVMVSVPATELELVNPKLYTSTNGIVRGKTMEQLKKENGWAW
jgi:hypothetical protein